jgi:hypothetical protein
METDCNSSFNQIISNLHSIILFLIEKEKEKNELRASRANLLTKIKQIEKLNENEENLRKY